MSLPLGGCVQSPGNDSYTTPKELYYPDFAMAFLEATLWVASGGMCVYACPNILPGGMLVSPPLPTGQTLTLRDILGL